MSVLQVQTTVLQKTHAKTYLVLSPVIAQP